MPLNKDSKQAVVAEVSAQVAKAQTVVLAEYRGITVGDLSQQLAEYFGTRDGVLVTSVTDNSAGSKAGIKAGDVITSFNGSEVTSPSNLRQRIRALQDGDEFTVGVMRDKKPITLKGKADTTRPRRTYRSIV